MKLTNYLTKYKKKLNNLERTFLIDIFYKDFGEKGLDFIVPQFKISKPDGSGEWKFDFYIKTKNAKYVIETDGLYSHAEGGKYVKTHEYFNNLQRKQNELSARGIKIIRFTNNLARNGADECIWELRRQFMGDPDLQNIYLNRTGEIVPHEVQKNALENLKESRERGDKRGLVILATGLGKTYLSAFDTKNFNPKKALFVVHINEILKQSMNSFQNVLKKWAKNMGLYNGEEKQPDKKIIFASIQTLSRKKHLEKFKPDEFDYIIIDESHHSAAPTYEKIFSYFKPKFFLGLTATPDRMDKKDILKHYDNNVPFEMGQEKAIKMGYLVPFHYYGFKDNIDYSDIRFNGFKYNVNDLNKLLMIKKRDIAIIDKYKKMAINAEGKVKKTIAFCTSIEHANYCAKQFEDAGFKSVCIHSKLDDSKVKYNEQDRDTAIKGFREGKYDIAFVVNMFNEGIDIPDVECLLFLRPTESKTIFIQHMGRGLRISPGKDKVLILDFIGNYKTAGSILQGLNIGDPADLDMIKKDKKAYYEYDNGSHVEFEEEVVDIFKKLSAQSTKKVREEALSEKWKEYAEYFRHCTLNNLYWKRGNQNKHFEVQLEALKLLKENPLISEKEFKTLIDKIVKDKYPQKTMTAGFRSLFISKIAGLFFRESAGKKKFIINEPAKKILNEIKDFSKLDDYKDLLTSQIEKIFYWNRLYGAYNKYKVAKDRVSFKDMSIYPMFFIYEIALMLKDNYGFETTKITKEEFDYFLALARNHSEVEDVAERVIDFRNYDEIYELKKLLKQKNSMDSRFYDFLRYNKYLDVKKDYFTIIPEKEDELREKLKKFNNLIFNNKLIKFNEEMPEIYENMLYSEKSLLEYHKKGNFSKEK